MNKGEIKDLFSSEDCNKVVLGLKLAVQYKMDLPSLLRLVADRFKDLSIGGRFALNIYTYGLASPNISVTLYDPDEMNNSLITSRRLCMYFNPHGDDFLCQTAASKGGVVTNLKPVLLSEILKEIFATGESEVFETTGL